MGMLRFLACTVMPQLSNDFSVFQKTESFPLSTNIFHMATSFVGNMISSYLNQGHWAQCKAFPGCPASLYVVPVPEISGAGTEAHAGVLSVSLQGSARCRCSKTPVVRCFCLPYGCYSRISSLPPPPVCHLSLWSLSKPASYQFSVSGLLRAEKLNN